MSFKMVQEHQSAEPIFPSLLNSSGPSRRLSRCRFLPLPIMKELQDVVPGNTYLVFGGGRNCWNGMSRTFGIAILDFRCGRAAR